jgi:hypothetical protein
MNLKRVRRLYRLEGTAIASQAPAPQTRQSTSRHPTRGELRARTLEHGFCTQCAHRLTGISDPDGGGSVESLDSDPRGGSQYVRIAVAEALDRAIERHGKPGSITP